MYGSPQGGRLANDQLTKHVTPKEYFQCTHSLGL